MSEESAKIGRPSLLQLDKDGNFKSPISEFLRGIRLGMSINTACDLAMIPSDGYITEWRNRAEEDKKKGLDEKSSIFILFSRELKNARAKFVEHHLEQLDTRDKGWQANAWLLERCARKDFGANSVNTDNTDKIEVIPDVPKHEEN